MLLAPRLALSQTLAASPSSLSFAFAEGGALPATQNVTITDGNSAVPFSVTVTSVSGGNWLEVSPPSGTTGVSTGILTAQVNPFSSGQTAGVYKANVVVMAGGQTLTIPATLTVSTALVPAPASLSFTTQQVSSGGVVTTPNPPSQTISIASSSGASIPFSATVSSTGNWLALSSSSSMTPSVLTVTANAAGFAPGNYSGSITLSSSSTPTLSVPVTLTVTQPLVFTFAPASLNFQSTSAAPQPPAQTVSVFSNAPSAAVATASTASGGNWLTVAASGSQTPVSLSIGVNPGSLAAGTYSGQINVAPKAGAAGSAIPVTLTVAAPQSPTIQLLPDTVTLAAAQGGLPIQTGLAVSNVGGGTLNYTAQITAQSGSAWLSLQSTAGSAVAGTPQTIPFTATPGSLTPGVYNGTITVTAGSQSASSAIIFTVGQAAPPLVLSQTGLAFTAVAQGANPPAQTVSVVNNGSGALTWSVTTSTLSGGSNWLSATPNSGTTQPLPAAPPSITVSVNTQNLAAGTYYGSVNVNSQTISIQTTVLPAGQTLSPALATDGIVLTAVTGGANPAAKTVAINNPLGYVSTTSTLDGANWFTLTPSANSVAIQGNLAALTPAFRYGTARLEFTDGSTQTLSILSVVTPAGTTPTSFLDSQQPQASSGCPAVLAPQMTSIQPGFSASVTQSVPLSVTVVDNCGQPLANSTSSSVTASFYNAAMPPGPSAKVQPDVRLAPQGNGVWAGTWTPQGAAGQLEIIVVALGISGTNPVAGQTTITGSVHNAPAGAPALAAGIFNAASFQVGNTIALGSFVSIFGSNLADGSQAPSSQPLPTQAQGTQVFLGGVALPLQYVGPNQINALIPANVAVNSQQPLVIQRDATQAAPASVTIAAAQPGIYTANQQGTGQGAVLTSDNSLDAPSGAYPGSHPATRGDYIQIFCTGLGAVTNAPAPGATAPNSPLSYTVAAVTANIGGYGAPVLFAGLAPGFIGLYQVNATVPMAAPVGDAVPLTLTVGSATSNPATIAVQ
jgi:uncharacterized protein (TIGR03437 family)